MLGATSGFSVTDDISAEAAIVHINGIRDMRRQISAFFAPLIAQWKQGLDGMRTKEREYTEPLRTREEAIQDKVQEFMVRRRREREEEERKRKQEIADANRKIEDARIEAAAKAESEGRPQEAERILDAPMPKPAFMNITPAPCQAPKTIAGATTRRTWHWRLADLALVPAEFKKTVLDEDKVELVFKRDREYMKISGVEIYSDETLVRR
jgi:hypothetical protein